jgi:hypothetical protein
LERFPRSHGLQQARAQRPGAGETLPLTLAIPPEQSSNTNPPVDSKGRGRVT